MTQLFQTVMPDETIPNSGTTSPGINWERDYFDAESITVFSPGVLAEGVGFQGSCDGGTTWNTINDGTNVAIAAPLAGCAIVYNGIFPGLTNLRFKASGAVAAARTFKIIKNWRP